MSDGYWRERYPAFGVGLILAASLLALALVPAPPSSAPAAQSGEYQRGEQIQPPVDGLLTYSDPGDEACSLAGQSSEADPDYHDKRDLCAQFRAAMATERAARETGAQTWIAGAGLIAVALALLFNVLATNAAAESARRAAESNEQARMHPGQQGIIA